MYLMMCSLMMLQPLEPGLRFARLGLARGLSQGTVSCMLRDRDGFFWFGTQDGLNRYDGYEFVIWRHEPDRPDSLSDSYINCLLEDDEGRMWVGTNYGLNRYDREQGDFVRYLPGDREGDLPHEQVLALESDSSGRLWVGLLNGLYRLNMADISSTRTRFEPVSFSEVSEPHVRTLLRDQTGRFWAAGRGIYRHNPEDDRMTLVGVGSAGFEPIMEALITDLHIGKQGNIWAASINRGLFEIMNPYGALPTIVHHGALSGSKSNTIFTLASDSDGLLWLGTQGGLLAFDPEHGVRAHFRHEPSRATSLSHNRVLCLALNKGILWAGTHYGISRALRDSPFRHFVHDPKDPYSLGAAGIRAFAEDADNNLWVGTTSAGLDYYDRAGGRFTHFRHDPDNPAGLLADRVTALACSPSGDLWVGTTHGLSRRDAGADGFRHYRYDPNDPNSLGWGGGTTALLFASDGSFWVGNWGSGLCRYRPQQDDFERFAPPARKKTSWKVRVLREDEEGSLWLGTWETGLLRFEPETARFTNWLRDPHDAHSLPHDRVLSLCPARNGVMWLGTAGGLARMRPDDIGFDTFTHQDGLLNNVVYGILQDDRDQLWLSTNMGLSRFDPFSGTFRNFTEQEGLQANEFNNNAYLRTRSGELVFGGVNGFNIFHPATVRERAASPPVRLCRFTVFDRDQLPYRVGERYTPISLSYSDNFFSLEFAALDYANPGRNQYRYKLDGFDEDWIDSGTRRYVSYTNLDGGNYRFRVQAAVDGSWGDSSLEIPVRITSAPWKTLWFRLGVVLAVAVLLWSGHRLRVKKLVEIERIRVRIASDLHDEVGSALTKISLLSDLLKEVLEPERKVHLLERIGRLGRDAVSAMGDLVWSVDARNDTVGSMIDRMRDFAADTFSHQGGEVEFELHGLRETRRLPVDLRKNLYLVFKEALTNVAKYAGASRVRVRLESRKRDFLLAISDNGRGLGKGFHRSGHGIRNMKMRARDLGGELQIIDTGSGLDVVLTTEPAASRRTVWQQFA
ncbi:MAG: two-component regulator propeller domain-containing protein [Acidobacteriota bacterium]|nr:two-component regulator propeller domain-containing protein [Acidobacteriota bacterium]